MNNKIDYKKLGDKAWRYREGGKPLKAIAILNNAVQSALIKEDWKVLINLLFDYSICWKILAKQNDEDKDFYNTSIQSLYFAKQVAEKYNIELRKDYSEYLAEVLTSAGEYEKAIQEYKKFLKDNKELSKEKKYNTQAHIGYCEAKIGNKQGLDKIKTATDGLEKSKEKNTHLDKHVTLIWLTGALMKYAEVLKDKTESKQILQKALKIAKQNNLEAREKQINTLLKKSNH